MISPLVKEHLNIAGKEREFAITNIALYNLHKSHKRDGENLWAFITRCFSDSDLMLTAEFLSASTSGITAEEILSDGSISMQGLCLFAARVGYRSMGLDPDAPIPLVENPEEKN